MQITPARMDQVRQSWNGGMVVVDRDVGGVAEELRRIDPGLRVRFAERSRPPCWVVLYQHCAQHRDHRTDCEDCRDGQAQDLVFTRQAWQNRLGVWEGLTHEVVDRVRQIDSHGTGGYDFAAEVERQNAAAEKAKRDAAGERNGLMGEELAHAIRKDLGVRYRGRAFINKKPEEA